MPTEETFRTYLIRCKKDPTYCLCLVKEDAKNRGQVQMWKEEPPADIWHQWVIPGDGTIRCKADTAYCLCLVRGNDKNHGRVQMWHEDPMDIWHKWSFDGELIRCGKDREYCLCLEKGGDENHGMVQMWLEEPPADIYHRWIIEEAFTDNLVDVTFAVDKIKVPRAQPMVIQEICPENLTETEQSVSLAYKKGITKTRSTSHKIGFKYEVKSKFQVCFPVAKSDLEISFSFNHEHQWTDTEAQTEETTVTVPVKVPPYSKVRAKAVTHEHHVEAPYTMHFESGRRVSGMWKGVAYSSVIVKFETVSMASS